MSSIRSVFLRSIVAAFAALFFVAGFVAQHAAAEPTVGAREGWVVIETDFSYADLAARLDEAIKAEKMGKVTQASATVGARDRLDMQIPGNKVVGVYRPDFAVRMLEASVAAGIEAPIRFYVTEEADGTATLSYKTPTTVFSPYFDEGGAELMALAAELDVIFAAIAERATAL